MCIHNQYYKCNDFRQPRIRHGESEDAGGRTGDAELIPDSFNYSLCSGEKVENELTLQSPSCTCVLIKEIHTQVQFRLRQIVDAPASEKETLLKELEEFAFRGIPDVPNNLLLESRSVTPISPVSCGRSVSHQKANFLQFFTISEFSTVLLLLLFDRTVLYITLKELEFSKLPESSKHF